MKEALTGHAELCSDWSRALYHITIYRLYRYFDYTIHIASFILVTQYLKWYTFLLKFRIFWSLNFPNFHEICGHIKFYWSKTRQNVSLVHIEYHSMCTVICIVSLKINDTEPCTEAPIPCYDCDIVFQQMTVLSHDSTRSCGTITYVSVSLCACWVGLYIAYLMWYDTYDTYTLGKRSCATNVIGSLIVVPFQLHKNRCDWQMFLCGLLACQFM